MKYGNDGVGYKKDDHQAKLQRLSNSPDEYKAELARVNSVMANRKTAGMDNSKQTAYLQQLQGAAPKPKQPNAQQYIDQLNDAQKTAALAGLDKSRNQALSNLQEEKAGIKPRYYDARNQTAAGNQQSARNFAEFMAARGGVRSGANAQAEISRQGTLQSNLGSLNRQENAAFDNIGRRTTDVNNAYESDVQSANAGIEAQRMQLLINQMNDDRGFGLQEAGLTGMYNGQQTLGGQQLDLQRSGQEFNQNQAQEEFAYQQTRDQIGDEDAKMRFDEDVRRFGLNNAIQRAQLAVSQTNAATSRTNAANNYQLSQDKFEYQKEQDTAQTEYQKEQDALALGNGQKDVEQQQKDTNGYNEFLMDMNRIKNRDEGLKLIKAYQAQGVSGDIITQMTKALNSNQFGY